MVERKDAWPTNDLSCQDGIVKGSTKICTIPTFNATEAPALYSFTTIAPGFELGSMTVHPDR